MSIRDSIFKSVENRCEETGWRFFMCPMMGEAYQAVMVDSLDSSYRAVHQKVGALRSELDVLNKKWVLERTDMDFEALKALIESTDDRTLEDSDPEELPIWCVIAALYDPKESHLPANDPFHPKYVERCKKHRTELLTYWKENLDFDFEVEE